MLIYVCMLMEFELVWLFVKFEWKMRKFWVLVKNEHNVDFHENWCYDSMFVVVLIAFWCILTNKQVWGTNLDQRGSKSGFLDENWVSSREEPKNLGSPVLMNSLSEWLLAVVSCTVQQPIFLEFRVLRGRPGLS